MNLTQTLTPREIEVLVMLVSDVRPDDIAIKLQTSRSTIRVHRHNIKLKTGLGLFALMGLAREQGIIQ